MKSKHRWLAKRFGLTAGEVERLYDHPRRAIIIDRLETWRESIGLPATNSGLVRGKLLSILATVEDEYEGDCNEDWGLVGELYGDV